MVRIHPGQPNKTKGLIERSGLLFYLVRLAGRYAPSTPTLRSKVGVRLLYLHIPAPVGAPPWTPRGLLRLMGCEGRWAPLARWAGGVRHRRRGCAAIDSDYTHAAGSRQRGNGRVGSQLRPSLAKPSAYGWAAWLPASGRHYRFKAPRCPPRFASLFPCAPANCRGSARVGWRDPEPHGCGDGAYMGEGALLARHCLASARTPSRQRLGRAAERELQRVPTIHPRRPSQANAQSKRCGCGFGRSVLCYGSRAQLGSTSPAPAGLDPALNGIAPHKRQKPGRGRAFAYLPAGSRRIPRQARWISAWRTGWRDVPCAGRPSYARLHGRHGS